MAGEAMADAVAEEVMAGAMAEGRGKGKRKEERVESLGWITESSVMPSKRREIEGVSASSILELKAQLYRSQQQAKASSDQPLPHAKTRPLPKPNDPFLAKNAGVQARDIRDKLELKAVNDGLASYKALEKKAEMYEKLSRGELPDDEEKERYCVDFFQKSLVQSTSEQQDHEAIAAESQKNEDVYDDSILPNVKLGPGRTGSVVDKDEHKQFVREVHEEVNQARERTSLLKIRRQEQELARREKLRQTYLRKQLEKLKAANKGQS